MHISTSMPGKECLRRKLCAWYVDRAWRTGLNDHVSTKESRIKIYHQLRLLLMEKEEATFRVLLQQFISFLDGAEEWFCKYFKEHYCNRLGQCKKMTSVVN